MLKRSEMALRPQKNKTTKICKKKLGHKEAKKTLGQKGPKGPKKVQRGPKKAQNGSNSQKKVAGLDVRTGIK